MIPRYLLILSLAFLAACKGRDDTPPELNVNGALQISLLIGDAYSDAGATAVDDRDGDLTSRIDVKGSVNTNQAGVYEITYTVSDFSGNESSATRTVTVNNTAAFFEGSYSVKDSVWGGAVTNYPDEINYSSITNNRIVVTRFANQLNGAVHMDYYTVGDAVNVPLQTLICGTVPASKTFSTPTPGGVVSFSPLKFVITYEMTVGMTTTTATATYTKN